MNNEYHKTLEQFNADSNSKLHVFTEHSVLEITRCGLKVQVIVPKDVLEWFAEVVEDNAVTVQDWSDYEGYDKTPIDELHQLMSSDIVEFVTCLLTCDIKLTVCTKTRLEKSVSKLNNLLGKLSKNRKILKYEIDGTWKQLLPFC